MKCLYCNKVMVVVEHEKIELDYCASCHGVWFDSGELELLMDSVKVQKSKQVYEDMVRKPEAETAEKKRKCPICNAKMKKTTVGERPAVLLDVCRRGHGLWFDGGELNHVIKELAPAAPDSHPDAVHFLGEVFRAV